MGHIFLTNALRVSLCIGQETAREIVKDLPRIGRIGYYIGDIAERMKEMRR